ncbi:hypothetical protein ACQ4WX_49680 [Streptomyces lasalocidi]
MEQVRAVVLRARHSAARARCTAEGTAWAVDLAPPGEEHLEESVLRALRQTPVPAGEVAAPGGAREADDRHAARTVGLVDWSAEQLGVFEEACQALRAAWPQMYAELAVTLRQVALLGGRSVEGFTDFTVHGAVFVNSSAADRQG